MSQGSKRPTNTAHRLLAALLAATLTTATAEGAAPVVEPPFDQSYTLVDLGAIAGLPLPYGGLSFVPGESDTIVVVGRAGAESANLYGVGLTRDETGSISGFVEPAIPLAEAYAASSGVAYGPGDVLFYTRATFEMGQVKPTSAITDKVISMRSLVFGPSGLNFVPAGLGDAGTLKVVTFNYGDWWSLAVTQDGNGTYDVTGAKQGPSLQGYPTGFAYVAPDAPGIMSPGLLVCERELSYGAGKVSAYDVDDHGDPVVATRRVVVSGLDVPEGVVVDPPTGDILFASYQGKLYLLRSAPFPTTTSSSTTIAPTTTTVHPATTTTSTTAHPTTTSTSSSTTLAISTTTTSSTVTTSTIPASSCGVQPGFEWIGCRVDALLAMVRASGELGPLQTGLVTRLERARFTVSQGAEACRAGRRALARRELELLERQMLLVRARTRTLRARRTIPRSLAEAIGDAARGIAGDARALRSSLVCD